VLYCAVLCWIICYIIIGIIDTQKYETFYDELFTIYSEDTYIFFLSWNNIPCWANTSSVWKLCDNTQTHYSRQSCPRHAIRSMQGPLPDKITLNIHKRQTSMPPAGFEHTIPANKWPQTNALGCTTTGVSFRIHNTVGKFSFIQLDKNFGRLHGVRWFWIYMCVCACVRVCVIHTAEFIVRIH
jgi:hypothetical protein